MFKLIRFILRLIYFIINKIIAFIGYLAGFRTNAPLFKTRLVVFALVVGAIQAPMYIAYAIQYPTRAIELTSKGYLGYERLKSDIDNLIQRTTPKFVNRYGIDSVSNGINEATRRKKVPLIHRLLSPFNLIRG